MKKKCTFVDINLSSENYASLQVHKNVTCPLDSNVIIHNSLSMKYHGLFLFMDNQINNAGMKILFKDKSHISYQK